jgi:hypothetical protein|nr:hypothetical protein [Kofleriaceae bacterium]
MRWQAAIGVLACAAACHAADSTPGDDAPTHTIVVGTLVPDYIAYRSDGGPWQAAVRGQAGYTITVADDYVLLLVCDNGGSGTAFDAEEFALTFHGDGATIFPFCTQPTPSTIPSDAPIAVTGTMAQPGTVRIAGKTASSATAPWTYAIPTVAGRHDVLAVDTAGAAVFDKGLYFDADSPGLAIDTAATGAPLMTEALAISGVGSDELRVATDVVSTGDTVISDSDGSDLTLVTMPASEIAPGDLTYIAIRATGAGTERQAFADALGSDALPASYDLLPPFAATAFEVSATAATGSWTAPPTATADIELEILAGGDVQAITASPSYLATNDLMALEFDDTAPGYLPAWRLDPLAATVDLAAFSDDETDHITYFSIGYPYAAATAAGPDARSSRRHRRSPRR